MNPFTLLLEHKAKLLASNMTILLDMFIFVPGSKIFLLFARVQRIF